MWIKIAFFANYSTFYVSERAFGNGLLTEFRRDKLSLFFDFKSYDRNFASVVKRVQFHFALDGFRLIPTKTPRFSSDKIHIMSFTEGVMIVYWEYAFLENLILDGLLLYLALKCARVKCRFLNLSLAASVGAAEAVAFPLFALPVWAAYLVKIAGGILISVIAIRKANFKGYLVVTASFFLMTFALGGLLVAAYSFFGAEYVEGNGFLVERAPVALVIGLAGVFTVLTVLLAKYFYRYRRIKRNLFSCVLKAGEKKARVTGFSDSGNLLSFRGRPVSVVSAVTALALFHGNAHEIGRMSVNTVNGSREAPVFECDLEIALAHKCVERKGALITVGDVASKEYNLILHTATLEGEDETYTAIKEVARKDQGKRERRKLSLRK